MKEGGRETLYYRHISSNGFKKRNRGLLWEGEERKRGGKKECRLIWDIFIENGNREDLK